jgi:hypothetical protein
MMLVGLLCVLALLVSGCGIEWTAAGIGLTLLRVTVNRQRADKETPPASEVKGACVNSVGGEHQDAGQVVGSEAEPNE